MEIHKPKPVQNWREFLSEISVVVCGILIALSLEQGLEALHSAHQAEQARRDVRAEAAVDLALMNVREGESLCIARRLDDLDARFASTDDETAPASAIWVGRPSDVPMFAERWRNVTASGRLSLFSPFEQRQLDNLFAVFGEFRAAELREQDAWTRLRILELWRLPIDPDMRRKLLDAVEAARHEDFEIRRGAHFGEGIAKTLGIEADPGYGDLKGAPHAVCLPETTPRVQALSVLKDRVPAPD